MSAYVVSHNHINSLVRFAYYKSRQGSSICLPDGRRIDPKNVEDLQDAAEILLSQNVHSVQTRYPDTIDNPQNMPGVVAEAGVAIRFTMMGKMLTAVEALKAIDCYEYQACEDDDYDQTAAHAIIERIKDMAINSLPGYDAASWDIE